MNKSHPTFRTEDCVFISDTHFGHSNIIKYCNRPFEYPNTDVMDAVMLNGLKHADAIGKTIFHMGDFVFKPENLLKTTWRPLGEHYIILGNHDKHADEGGKYRTLYKEFFTNIIGHSKKWKENEFYMNLDDRRLVLTHEARKNLGWAQYNIYGHHHNKMLQEPERYKAKVKYNWLFGKDTHFNASVELTNYLPVTFAELVEIPRP